MSGKPAWVGVRWLRISLAVSLVVAAAGCGSKGTISGKVKYKGKELQTGHVTFVSETTNQSFNATIGEDGSYTMTKVPAGPVKIGVKSGPTSMVGGGPPKDMGGKFGPPGGVKDAPEGQGPPKDTNMDPRARGQDYPKVPDEYGDPEKSKLTYVVVSGSQTHDIEIPPK